MSNIKISTLSPSISLNNNNNNSTTKISSIAVQLKLNNDIIQQIKEFNKQTGFTTVRLIVKDGKYFIKVSEELQFPCLKVPENLNVDIYSLNTTKSNKSNFNYNGRVLTKLTVITDSKRINQLKNSKSQISSPYLSSSPKSFSSPKFNSNNPSVNPSPIITPFSSQNSTPSFSPVNPPNNHKKEKSITPIPSLSDTLSIYSSKFKTNPFKIEENELESQILKKLLYLVALGPISLKNIIILLEYKQIEDWLSKYCQIYNKNDSFIQNDKFPYIETNEDQDKYILKDKSYKDIIPLNWEKYDDYERNSIIKNINNALTRLGYSKTHPLRNKITQVQNSSDISHNEGKVSKLGGGFLISKNSKSKKKIVSDSGSERTSPSVSNVSTPINTPSSTPLMKHSSQFISPTKQEESKLPISSSELSQNSTKLNRSATISPSISEKSASSSSSSKKSVSRSDHNDNTQEKIRKEPSTINQSPTKSQKLSLPARSNSPLKITKPELPKRLASPMKTSESKDKLTIAINKDVAVKIKSQTLETSKHEPNTSSSTVIPSSASSALSETFSEIQENLKRRRLSNVSTSSTNSNNSSILSNISDEEYSIGHKRSKSITYTSPPSSCEDEMIMPVTISLPRKFKYKTRNDNIINEESNSKINDEIIESNEISSPPTTNTKPSKQKFYVHNTSSNIIEPTSNTNSESIIDNKIKKGKKDDDSTKLKNTSKNIQKLSTDTDTKKITKNDSTVQSPKFMSFKSYISGNNTPSNSRKGSVSPIKESSKIVSNPVKTIPSQSSLPSLSVRPAQNNSKEASSLEYQSKDPKKIPTTSPKQESIFSKSISSSKPLEESNTIKLSELPKNPQQDRSKQNETLKSSNSLPARPSRTISSPKPSTTTSTISTTTSPKSSTNTSTNTSPKSSTNTSTIKRPTGPKARPTGPSRPSEDIRDRARDKRDRRTDHYIPPPPPPPSTSIKRSNQHFHNDRDQDKFEDNFDDKYNESKYNNDRYDNRRFNNKRNKLMNY
ncbi:hypothetical protein KGF54_001259 [Candida jiufengensis]|uniref:uncharacterized protein n=1 Tax=Candida jiufengensis TaxID=497108 RepID=UPI002224E971|nr:uncharacterized protein KGF54_001259 [Candida jiufengensis]KAI5955757.1 hypothetical protein KGF54_001259 [Candida jiufengensis]